MSGYLLSLMNTISRHRVLCKIRSVTMKIKGLCRSFRKQLQAKEDANITLSMRPIVSKVYCSPTDVILQVRQRPNAVNGGGFVVSDCSKRVRGVVFRVDGCGVSGRKKEVILRDGEGNELLIMRREGGIITRQWNAYSNYFLGSHKLDFTIKEQNSCFSTNCTFRIYLESKEHFDCRKFVVRGNFPARSCCIVNSIGDVVAKVGVDGLLMVDMRDVYNVEIKAGVDEAFVFGVIAVLDYMHNGSTRC